MIPAIATQFPFWIFCASSETIRVNAVVSNFHAAVGGVIVLALLFDRFFHRRKSLALPIACCLMLIHPAWTIPHTGNEGAYKRELSYWVTGILVALLLWRFGHSQFLSKQDGKSEKR